MPDKNDQSLMGFVSSLQGGNGLRVEENLGSGYVRLRVLEAERRQAQHDIRCVEDILIELLRNSRDAGASSIFVATSREKDQRLITIIDNGCGVPEDMHERIFDARVTSKLDSMHMDRWGVHGRGMALFSIKQNVQKARILASAPQRGCAMHIEVDTQKLPERKDQSTWPHLTHVATKSKHAYGAKTRPDALSSDADKLGRGPHNLIRTGCEFGLESEGTCKVYIGSAAQIAATIVSRAKPRQDVAPWDLTLVEELARCTSAGQLAKKASELGLVMSERNALRILSGEIEPLFNVCTVLRAQARTREHKSAGSLPDLASIRFSPSDAEELSDDISDAIHKLAERYYFATSDDVDIAIKNNKLVISVPIVEDE
ncbi:MAG: ATP-binding protein [Atopobiaceae bacterium]|jgi:anti-sigma regulatory factor (Ser/Thr protein kinase)